MSLFQISLLLWCFSLLYVFYHSWVSKSSFDTLSVWMSWLMNLVVWHFLIISVTRCWKLTTANICLEIVSNSHIDDLPISIYEVWRESETLDYLSGWERILLVGPVLARYQSICFSDNRCVLADSSCKFYIRDNECARNLYYSGRGMFAQVKEIRGKSPFKFSIKACVNYCGSLTTYCL